MTKAAIDRRLRALEADQPKPGLGTLPDPVTGDAVPVADLLNLLTYEDLKALEKLYLSEMEEGRPGFGPQSTAFLVTAFDRRRARMTRADIEEIDAHGQREWIRSGCGYQRTTRKEGADGSLG